MWERQVRYFPFYLGAFFVLFSAIFVLGNYQGHGGDFGHYITLARNLMLGRSWDHLVSGYPSYLPGYPALLVIPTAIFGVNFYVYAVINSILWAGCSIAAFYYFKDQFLYKATPYIFLIGVLFVPFLISFQQKAIPNILYATAVMLALFISRQFSAGKFHPGLAVIVLIPAIIRSEACGLYAALIAFFVLQRRFKLCALPIAGLILSISINLFLALNYEVISFFNLANRFMWGASNEEFDFIRQVQAHIFMFSNYLFGFGQLLFPHGFFGSSNTWHIVIASDLSVNFGPIQFLLTAIFGFGIFKHRNYLSLDKIFFVSHMALLSAYLLLHEPGGLPLRYLTPLLPIYIFYLIYGLEYGMALIKLPMRPVTNSILLASIVIGFLAFAVPSYMGEPARRNVVSTSEMRALADWLSENMGKRVVGYYKPRVMTMLLDIRSESTLQGVGIRSIENAEMLLNTGGIVVIRKAPLYNQETLLEYLQNEKNVNLLWEDQMHAVFAR
ncbi:hypothetical protein [Nitrospina gracilis]|uniref:hypothetical protein n=1 Tax=Nitrospina gracilis TaxID=35801 RepID=UPI001F17870C|nr:hypothetical protein [Nitrospina gracilis]MCF8719363.1 hypothetical protein [Nitrospina gracilis Nb-211]